MAKEIERKFLVDHLPVFLLEQQKFEIIQGYISADPNGREVRLRKKGETYWLTIKDNGGLERNEYEVQLSQAQFETLWQTTESRRIIKDRYVYKHEGYAVEVDVYHQPLKGLIVAEVEFPSKEEALRYKKAPWMSKEVTHLNFLKNKNLLQFDNFGAIKAKL